MPNQTLPHTPGFLTVVLQDGTVEQIPWGKNRQAVGASVALDTNDSNSTQAGHTSSLESGAKTSESQNPNTIKSELGDNYVVVTPGNSPRNNSQSPTPASLGDNYVVVTPGNSPRNNSPSPTPPSLKDSGSTTLASSKDSGSR